MIGQRDVFLLDMDGTIYLGEELIPGAEKFFDVLQRQKKQYLFLTNNSSKNTQDYVEKLQRLHIPVQQDQIFSSADATMIYIKEHFPEIKKIFLLTTPSMENSFQEAGFILAKEQDRDAQCVVLTFDTTLTYQKLWTACDIIREKGFYIATHPDLNCPLAGGKSMPDIGGMIALIKACTGVSPLIIGKPYKTMIEAICNKFHWKKEQLVMIGDRLYTDIQIGAEAGIETALVFSGETSRQMYEDSPINATYCYSDVGEIAEELEG